ncbi:MAG: isocitrate/isopropylmalate family dehydrogenase [Gemmatimonadota bacterium]|jgi:3-isopropylmalate dehydrogenase|nr:isocitrate/isopropylmalate family dehydrogenase [Gemmatimonadota bacterium]MDP6802589.1 isocitrate/isopropylmalate family dehydrogenase [Gemmatimonadota bacterium]MDP7030714.1 isocitrate/isopropylmalate family dehydrogenase [Gemmatimonadota bacterium]
MKKTYSLVVLPGDGIGVEVTAEAMKVLHAVGDASGVCFDLEEIECGGHYYAEHGVEWPSGSLEKCRAADAIFLGAVGHEEDGLPVFTKPGQPYDTPQLAGYAQVIGNRMELDLYANVRPVRLYPGVSHKVHGELKGVWSSEKVDYVVVRENTEGAYTGETHELSANEGGPGRETPIRITEAGTKRIVRYAFDLALRRATERQGSPSDRAALVTCVEKSNIIGAHRYFREIFHDIGATEYPEVPRDTAYFDAFCMWQVRNPEWFDVVVAPNLVGDVVSDLGSATQGGMGVAAGGNIGERHGMFEPIHGSAPKHAGQDKANPIAAVLALRMLLGWLGDQHTDERLQEAGRRVEGAVAEVLRDGNHLTYDLSEDGRGASCSSCGTALAEGAVTNVQW